MQTSLRVATRAGLMAAAIMAGVTGSTAQETINSSGWYKACSDQGDNRICNVQYQAVASTGQVITSVNLAEISGKVTRRIFQITVPTGRLVPPGLRVNIGQGAEKKIPFSFCTPRICAAELDLNDALINEIKAGAEMKILSVNWQGKENPLSIPLTGFTVAYDGAPITQDELKKREADLAAQLKSKSDDLLDKLKKAQEAARNEGGSVSE